MEEKKHKRIREQKHSSIWILIIVIIIVIISIVSLFVDNKKFQNNMKPPLWIDRVLRDFRYVDCNLLYQTIEKLGIE